MFLAVNQFRPYFPTKPPQLTIFPNATGNFDLKNVCRATLQKHPIEKKRERISNSKEVQKRQEGFWPILKPPLIQVFLETAFRFRGGLVLSYRWFALCVGFGRSNFAAVSSYHIVGSRQVLLLDVPFPGGFVLSSPRYALGVGSGRYPESQKALEFLFPAQLSG